MILTNRSFIREAPKREAKSIYIFCEGAKREYQYFDYFKEMDSRINVEVYKLKSNENNSPLGLLSIAKECIIPTKENPKPKYSFQKNDEVWIVLDTDKDATESRAPQIKTIIGEIKDFEGWNLVQSNPCFEVWLYYHLHAEKPEIDNPTYCKSWKQIVNEVITGGFDARKHPIYIETATRNTEKNFQITDTVPNIGCSEVFYLSKSILPLISKKLERVIQELG